MLRKRYGAALSACLLCAATLCGCGTPWQTPTSSGPDYQKQISMLVQSQDKWDQARIDDVLPNDYYYAVSDLDWNGRLEIMAMSTQGTGIYTYGTIYEVNEDGTALAECSVPCTDGESLPEMIMNFVPAAYDRSDGSYYYVFKDDCRNGAAEYYQSIQAINLTGGVLSARVLGRMSLLAADGVTQEEYFRGEDKIAPEEYEAIIPAFQADLEGFTANFQWFQVEDSADKAMLTKSWEFFRSSHE